MTLEADFTVRRRSLDVMVAIALQPGDRLSLFGPSGAGKTSALEALAGAVALEAGEVRLDGRLVNRAAHLRRRQDKEPKQRLVAPRRAGIALLRQPTSVFPHLSAGQNVAYGLPRARAARGRSPAWRRRAGPATARDAEIASLLTAVGLEGLEAVSPVNLSGGQRQRLALARSLARPWRALLMDEPFSAVDIASRRPLHEVAAEAAARHEALSILVTHDLHEAQMFGQLMALIDHGRIIQMGDPEKLARHPASTRAAELLGYTAFIPRDEATAWAIHPDRCRPGNHPDYGVVISGTVIGAWAAGARMACELRTDNAEQRVMIHTDNPPATGTDWQVTALDPPLVARVADKA